MGTILERLALRLRRAELAAVGRWERAMRGEWVGGAAPDRLFRAYYRAAERRNRVLVELGGYGTAPAPEAPAHA